MTEDKRGEKPSGIGLNTDGVQLIKAWHRSCERENSLAEQLEQARLDRRNNATELARWLLPKDADIREAFSVAYSDTYLVVMRDGDTYAVSWRKGKWPSGGVC